MQKKYLLFLTVVLFFSFACAMVPRETAREIEPAPLLPTAVIVTLRPAVTSTARPTALPTSEPVPAPVAEWSGEVRSLWAVDVLSDLETIDLEYVIGSTLGDFCEDGFDWVRIQPNSVPDTFYLQLNYTYPVNPGMVNVYIVGDPGSTMRVELMDSRSGLGADIFEGKILAGDDCPNKVSIPVDTDLMVDTVILTFQNVRNPFLVDGVELVGVLPGYLDLPVFWRVPLTSDSTWDTASQLPGGLAVDPFGVLYVANGRNGLLRYDVEGNLVRIYSVPTVSNVSDVAIDQWGNMVVTDNVYQWFIIYNEDGEQMNAGGEDFGFDEPREAAVSPVDGNIYLLDSGEDYARVRVYALDTAAWIRDIPLDKGGPDVYTGLAFDSQGYLYMIDRYDATVIKMDPVSGKEVNVLGYDTLAGTSPFDLALDADGNLYILLITSRDDNAVYTLGPNGALLSRFGSLDYECADHSEGRFCFPLAITVTQDGRFVFILENGYLTAYRIEK
jgi:DNA-binding beta-propeller fold protein YncE